MRNPNMVVRAKSDVLAEERRKAQPGNRRSATRRLPLAERRALILAKASEFFAEYGLTAQTRALAEACAISQRLLYRCFPSKAALIEEVYGRDIAGPFRAIWFAQLADRSVPVEERLIRFYGAYCDEVLTRRWLRLFLYASLADIDMAPTYIADVITRMLELIVDEAAQELGVRAPAAPALKHELGWVLHGAISHLAIRRHIYRSSNPTPVAEVIGLSVRMFLGGMKQQLPRAA